MLYFLRASLRIWSLIVPNRVDSGNLPAVPKPSAADNSEWSNALSFTSRASTTLVHGCTCARHKAHLSEVPRPAYILAPWARYLGAFRPLPFCKISNFLPANLESGIPAVAARVSFTHRLRCDRVKPGAALRRAVSGASVVVMLMSGLMPRQGETGSHGREKFECVLRPFDACVVVY